MKRALRSALSTKAFTPDNVLLCACKRPLRKSGVNCVALSIADEETGEMFADKSFEI